MLIISMVILSHMISKVNLYKKISQAILILKVMKLNGSSSMLVTLIDYIKLLSTLNLPTEKNNSLLKPNTSNLAIML
jgi:hypothetical protein